MKELENFINRADIDKTIHNKIINNNDFNKLSQKICSDDYREIINQIYWMSMLVYRVSFTSYIDNLNINNKTVINKNNILVYHPFSSISSEMCRIVNDKYIYTSFLSVLSRQIIEQICVVKEIESEKIELDKIVEAMIESHNKHVGAQTLNIDGLNFNNEGLLKVFNTSRKYGNLAKKYSYHFLYNLFSGDIHHLSTIDKNIPKAVSNNAEYNNAYLLTVLSLLKDALLFVNSFCNKLSAKDIKRINEMKFIVIKD